MGQLPDLFSVWFVPFLCFLQRNVSPWKLFPMHALLWGSLWGSSLTSPPSFPGNRERTSFEFILHGKWEQKRDMTETGSLQKMKAKRIRKRRCQLTLHHSSLESSSTVIRSPGLIHKHTIHFIYRCFFGQQIHLNIIKVWWTEKNGMFE